MGETRAEVASRLARSRFATSEGSDSGDCGNLCGKLASKGAVCSG